MAIDEKTFKYQTHDNGFRNREATNEYFERKYPNTIELVSQRLKEKLSPEKNVVWFHMHETIYKDIEQPKDRNADELKGYYQGQGYIVMLRHSNQCMPDMFYNGFWIKLISKHKNKNNMTLIEAIEKRDKLKNDIKLIDQWRFKQAFETPDAPKNKDLWTVIQEFVNGLDVECRILDEKIKECTNEIFITD